MMVATSRVGCTSGSVMWTKCCHREVPSTRAASFNSLGIVCRLPREDHRHGVRSPDIHSNQRGKRETRVGEQAHLPTPRSSSA